MGLTMDSALLLALVTTLTSAFTVAGVLLLARALRSGELIPPPAPDASLGANRLDAVFLFDDRVLIDANDRAVSLLSTLSGGGAPGPALPWDRLMQHLSGPFPGLAGQLLSLAQAGRLDIPASDGSGLALTAEWLGDAARLTLVDSADDSGSVLVDRMSWRAQDEELSLLRRMMDASPAPAWRENAAAEVVWANAAYLRVLAGQDTALTGLGWPLPAVFAATPPDTVQRLCIRSPARGGRESWFDVSRSAEPAGWLCFATPADEAQRAERTKRDFVQTLTKTFATLPIGLAVFDRTRRLQLFNPALTDLTGLEPEFLLSRPGIEGFLNRMRDKRVLPEPRDWHLWSRRLLEVETGDGAEFEETWALAGGQTFRVSARPHPDGALAFLIEDISAETHMSRNFRAELTATRAALDLLTTALAVFGSNGQLVLTNAAFSNLWLLEGAESLAGITLAEAVSNWREVGGADALWDNVLTVARSGGTASGRMVLEDGEVLSLQAHRGAGGQVLIAFETEQPAPETADAPVTAAQDRTAGLPAMTMPPAVPGMPAPPRPGKERRTGFAQAGTSTDEVRAPDPQAGEEKARSRLARSRQLRIARTVAAGAGTLPYPQGARVIHPASLAPGRSGPSDPGPIPGCGSARGPGADPAPGPDSGAVSDPVESRVDAPESRPPHGADARMPGGPYHDRPRGAVEAAAETADRPEAPADSGDTGGISGTIRPKSRAAGAAFEADGSLLDPRTSTVPAQPQRRPARAGLMPSEKPAAQSASGPASPAPADPMIDPAAEASTRPVVRVRPMAARILQARG